MRELFVTEADLSDALDSSFVVELKMHQGMLWLRKRARGISNDLQFLGFSA